MEALYTIYGINNFLTDYVHAYSGVVAAESVDEAISLLEEWVCNRGPHEDEKERFSVSKEEIFDSGFKADKKGVIFPEY